MMLLHSTPSSGDASWMKDACLRKIDCHMAADDSRHCKIEDCIEKCKRTGCDNTQLFHAPGVGGRVWHTSLVQPLEGWPSPQRQCCRGRRRSHHSSWLGKNSGGSADSDKRQ